MTARDRRLVFVVPDRDGVDIGLAGALSRAARDLADVWPDRRIAVHRAAPPPSVDGLTVHRVLAGSAAFWRDWEEKAATLPLVRDENPLAERLGFLGEVLDLGAQDALVLADARLADLEMVYEFFLRRPAGETPLVFAHLRALFRPDRVPSGEEALARLRMLTRRLDRLDLAGTRLVVTAESPVVVALLAQAGLAAVHASLDPDGLAEERGGAVRVDIVSDEAGVAALDALATIADGRAATRLRLVRPAAAPPESDFSAAARRVPGLSIDTLAGADFRDEAPHALLADPDLLPACLAAPDTLARTRLLPWTAGAPLADQLAPLRDVAADLPPPPPGLWAVMREREAGGAPTGAAPLVLHIAPAWSASGSSHVFDAQLRYLEERGYAVLCLHLDSEDAAVHDPDAPARLARRLPGETAVARWVLGRDPRIVRAEKAYGLLRPYEGGMFSLEGESRIGREVQFPASLSAALAARRPDVVVLNYAHYTPIVRRLGLDGVPVILETHDVRTVQHAIYDRRGVDEADQALEYALFTRCDTTVFINRHEEDALRAMAPDHRTATVFPFLDEVAGDVPQPGESGLSWLLRAVGGPRPLAADRVAEMAAAPHERPPIAVFVGTDHRANVLSLRWYLEEVVVPYLADTGIVTVVIGNIHASFPGVDLPNVHFVGRVSELEPWYRAADVVLLPIRHGTGLPIKTLDALAVRRPFVACSGALKAISGMVERFGAFDAADGFAREVERLATQEEARMAAVRAIDSFVAETAQWAHYRSAWDAVLSPYVTPRTARLTALPERPVPAAPLPPPAFAREGRAWPSPGAGLDGLVNIRPQEDGGGLAVVGDYARLRVRADEDGEATLAMRLSAAAGRPAARVAFYVDGEPAGIARADAGETVLVPFAPGRGRRAHVLEIAVLGADGPRPDEEPRIVLDRLELGSKEVR